MAKELKNVVATRLKQIGRNPFEAARKGYLERSFVNDILIGKKISVKGNMLGRLAQALDWSLAELIKTMEDAGGSEAAVHEKRHDFEETSAAAAITVIGGQPVGGAAYSAASSEEIGTLKCPPGLAGMTGVYAIYMIGSSMEPRFAEGKPLYVSATRAPAAGDDVVLETVTFPGDAKPRRYVRKLIEITETEWILKMHNPAGEDRLKASTVKFVHRIFPQEELL